VGECFFWYRLTQVVLDKFHRAVKRLCVCVCVCVAAMHLLENPVFANAEHIFVVAFSALTLLLGGRKGIQPIKNSGGILAWLCVCVKVQICIWPS